MNPHHINGIYRIQRKIGSGTFSTLLVTSLLFLAYKRIGEVFLAHNILTIQDNVIKLEPLKTSQYLLEHKYQVYKKISGGISIACVHWFGTEGGFNVMVLDCLGQSLQDLFAHCCFRFTLQTVLVLAEQLVCMTSLSLNNGFCLYMIPALSPKAHSLLQLHSS